MHRGETELQVLGAGLPFQVREGVPTESETFSVASDLQIEPVQSWRMFIVNSGVDFERKRVGETFGPSSRKRGYTVVRDRLS